MLTCLTIIYIEQKSTTDAENPELKLNGTRKHAPISKNRTNRVICYSCLKECSVFYAAGKQATKTITHAYIVRTKQVAITTWHGDKFGAFIKKYCADV